MIALFLCAALALQDPPPKDVELTYRLLFTNEPEKTRIELGAQVRDVLRLRLDLAGMKDVTLRVRKDEVIVLVPKATPEALLRCKGFLAVTGTLEFRATAPKELQEKYNIDAPPSPPAGYRVFENPAQKHTGPEYADWAKPRILLSDPPVVTGAHIVKSEATAQLHLSGKTWVTSFELSEEGARLFDATAKRLYHRKPSGMIAIVLDGRIHSTPTVQAEAFRGQGQITGAKTQEEAHRLAVILRAGALPVQIGRIADGKPRPGEPESEK